MMDVHMLVPGMDSVISVIKDSMNVGLGTAMAYEFEGQVKCRLCVPMHCGIM